MLEPHLLVNASHVHSLLPGAAYLLVARAFGRLHAAHKVLVLLVIPLVAIVVRPVALGRGISTVVQSWLESAVPGVVQSSETLVLRTTALGLSQLIQCVLLEPQDVSGCPKGDRNCVPTWFEARLGGLELPLSTSVARNTRRCMIESWSHWNRLSFSFMVAALPTE